ncbi:MAG: 50S ribosomal protein L6 [Patescibacteria group bacterium]
MSKIGKKPIAIPSGVEVKINGLRASVKGPKGQTEKKIPAGFTVTAAGGVVTIVPTEKVSHNPVLWGLARATLNNMITGVSEGFKEVLELNGVGYKAAVKGSALELNLGFSHPINFPLPEGIVATVEKNILTISGIDRELVGQTAAQIRMLKKPEPYKGHGIKYSDEIIRRKAGKKAATAA